MSEQENSKEKNQEIQSSKEPENQDTKSVYIGKKPFLNYIINSKKKFTSDGLDEIVIKSRGKLINRAVDLAEVLKKNPPAGQDIKIEKIEIGSEMFKNDKGKEINVSTIEIFIKAEPKAE
ncbi:MAG: RNA-binding protein [Nanoarchaeota archaeon]